MALFYASAFVTGTVAGGANGTGAPNGTGTTTTGNTNWTGQWTMSALGGTVSGTTPVSVWAKKEAGQSGTPSMVVTVTSSTQGTIFTSASTNVTATTFTQMNLGNITATGDLGTLTMDISATSAGGGPSVRTTIQVDAMAVDATVTAPPTPKTGSDTGSFSVTESIAFAQSAFTRTETGTISATEAVSFGTSTFSSTDSGSVSATETAAVSVILSSTDSGAVSATETADVQSILALKSGSDSGTVAAFEGYSAFISEGGGGGGAAYSGDNTLGGEAQGSSRVFNKPANTANGDLVLFHLAFWVSATGFTITGAPAGAVSLGSQERVNPTGGGYIKSFVYGIVAGAETTYTFSWTGSQWNSGIALRVTNADTTNIAGYPHTFATSAGTATGLPSVSATATGGELAIWFGNQQGYSAGTALTSYPTNYTGITGGQSHSAAHRANVSAGTETASGAVYNEANEFVTAIVLVPGTGGAATESYLKGSHDTSTITGTDAGTIDGGATPITANDSGTITGSDASSAPVNILVDKSASDSGTFTGTDASSTVVFSGLWPTSVSGRNVLDQNGDPWFNMNYQQWNLIGWGGGRNETGVGTTTPNSAFEAVAAELESQGFNSILVLSITSNQGGETGPNQDGSTWDNIDPWGGGGIGDLNEDYWSRVDDFVDIMATHGITVYMYLMSSYTLYAGTAFAGINNTNAATFGTAIGNRYKDKPNIIWVYGADYFDSIPSQIAACQSAIEATGDNHLFTVEFYAESSTTIESDGSSPGTVPTNFSFNDVYSYNAAAFEVRHTWANTTKPTVHMNGYYYQTGTASDKVMTDLMGWAITSGSKGFFVGSEGTWQNSTGYLSNIQSDSWPNNNLNPVLSEILALDGWGDLVPDLDSSFITSSRGTDTTAYTSGGGGPQYNTADPQNNYLTGAVTPSGNLALLYTPVSRTITINNAELVANYTAKWIDPYSGAITTATSNQTSYATPGNNSAGNQAWYLALEEDTGTAFKSASDSGTISSTDSGTVVVVYEEKSASDSGTFTGTDATSDIAGTVSTTDSGTLSATDSGASFGLATTAETGTISATDVALDRFVFVDPAAGGAGGPYASERFTFSSWDADSINSAPYAANNAGDLRWSGAAEERWQSASTAMPHWVRGFLPESKAANWYSVDPGRNSTDPSAWTFEGTTDPTGATGWVVLDTRSGQSFTDAKANVYTFSNDTEYAVYRMHITAGQNVAASVSELSVGRGQPQVALGEYLQANSMNSSNITTGLLFVVNSTVTLHALYAYVGVQALTWRTRIVDSSGNILAEESYTSTAAESGFRELPLATPLVLAPGNYMIEYYSGARYPINSLVGVPSVDINYGQSGEITIPANNTVSYRGNSLTCRYGTGDSQPTLSLGQYPINAFLFTEGDINEGAGGTATDSGDIVATEATSITVTLSASDSGAVSATETASISGTVTSSDSGTVSSTESSSLGGSANQSAADSGTVSGTEVASVSGTLTSTDTGTFTGADAGSIVAVYDEKSGTDSGTLSATESTTIQVSVSATDTGSVSVTDSALSSGTVTATDSGTLTSTESGTFNQTPVAASDSGAVSVTDSGTVQVIAQYLSASDSGTVSAAEIASSGGTGVGSDSGSVASIESTSILVTLTRSDSGTLSAADSALVEQTRVASDSGTVSATELSDLQISGGADKSGNDTGTVSATAETGSLQITTYVVAGDSGTVQATEIAASSGTVSAADAGTVTAVDGGVPGISVPASDSGTLSVTEGSAVVQFEGVTVNVWNGTQFVVGRMRVWDGTQFVDPVVRVWNGSGWVLYP